MSEMLLTAYNGAILGPIAKLLGAVMNKIYYLMSLIGIENVGLSIIIFTFFVYLCLFPLTYKQQKFSKLQQKMQPEIQAINKKYKDKKDQASVMAMQQETQAVYQKYGVSMAGSCVQLLIQMPLLLSLYQVFLNVPAYVAEVKNNFMPLVNGIMGTSGYQNKMMELVETLKIVTRPAADFTLTDQTALSNSIVDVLYKLNSTGWDTLKDAFPSLEETISSTYETVSHVNTFFVFNISDSPWHIITTNYANGKYLMVIGALLIPILSYATQVISMKLIPQSSSGSDQADAMANQMKTMNKTMPLISLIMCFSVPVGLGIYWIAGAVVRSVQQFLLNKHFEKIDVEDIIKKNQEKAKKKRERMGISDSQIYNAARMNTKNITAEEREKLLENASAMKVNAKKGSMTAKANMVRDFNEKNSRK